MIIVLVINVTLVAESLQIVGDAALHFYSRVTLQSVVFVIVQDCYHSPSECFLSITTVALPLFAGTITMLVSILRLQ